MKKTLEALWHGNIAPQTRSFNHGTHYEEALKMMCKNEENLKSLLNDEEREIFEKFCDCRDEVDLYTEEDIFVTGFRLGARIVIEAFCENDGLFRETTV